MEILLEMDNVNYKTIYKHLFSISKDILTGNCEGPTVLTLDLIGRKECKINHILCPPCQIS